MTEPTPKPEGETAPPAPRKRGRPPRNPEQRERSAKRSAVRRLLKKLEHASDSDELFRLLEEERESEPEPKEAKEAKEAPEAEPAREGETLEPGQRAGWPAPSVVAQHLPLARELWEQLAAHTAGTRYATCLARREIVIEVPCLDASSGVETIRKEVETYDPTDRLAQATAPVIASELPALASTPTAALVVTVVGVFGPTFLAQVWELGAALVNRWWGPKPEALASVHPLDRDRQAQ